MMILLICRMLFIIKKSKLLMIMFYRFNEFIKIREIINNVEKLQDYLDYLHIKEVKKKNDKLYTFVEAKKELEIAD